MYNHETKQKTHLGHGPCVIPKLMIMSNILKVVQDMSQKNGTGCT